MYQTIWGCINTIIMDWNRNVWTRGVGNLGCDHIYIYLCYHPQTGYVVISAISGFLHQNNWMPPPPPPTYNQNVAMNGTIDQYPRNLIQSLHFVWDYSLVCFWISENLIMPITNWTLVNSFFLINYLWN